MKKKTILITLLIILLLLILLLIISIFFLDIKSFFVKDRSEKKYKFLNTDQITVNNEKKEQSDGISKKEEDEKNFSLIAEKEIKSSEISKKAELKEIGNEFFSKGATLEDYNFNALGEYVSEDEKKYRYEVIKNLKIKTIIIDYLTPGNGVTQEFYKVSYKEKMIPAKILDQLIESNEFRNLIPEKYLKNEKSIKLKNNEKIIFHNYKISHLLLLWCEGKLTPIKKAWQTQALSSK